MLEGKAVIGKRIMAYLVDLLVVLGCWFVLAAAGAALGACAIPFMNEAEKFTPLIIGIAVGGSLGLLLGLGWFLVKDGFGGRSFGKKMFGLRVVKIATGEPAGLLDSLVRNLFLIVSPLNLIEYVMIFADAEAQRLGDKVRGLKVVGEDK